MLFINNDIKFDIEWITRYSLTHFEDHLGLRASVIFKLQYVWFLKYVDLIANSSGQLAKIIVCITPLE